MKYLTKSECDTLKATLRKIRTRESLILTLLYETGARASEVLNLTPQDIDSSEGMIFIKTIKNGRPRYAPLSDETFSWLVGEAKAIAPSERIFPISYQRLHQIWLEYRPFKKKLHALRHAFAVDVFRETRDPKMVQTLLGHRSMSSTMVYLDFVYAADELRRAVRLVRSSSLFYA